MKLDIIDWTTKSKKETIDVPQFLLEEFKPLLIQEVYHYHSLNRRQATYGTLTKSELSYSGKKLWRQKRTGRARVGERGAVHHRKGHVCFGPNGREYELKMPKKKIRKALFSLLSHKLASGELIVTNHMNMSDISTKEALNYLVPYNPNKTLLIDHKLNTNLILSIRNIPLVNFLPNIAFNVYDIFRNKFVIMSKDSLDQLEDLCTRN